VCAHCRFLDFRTSTNLSETIKKEPQLLTLHVYLILPFVSIFLPSNRSLNTVLSDLPDADVRARHQIPTDFTEGMEMIYDALHPYVDDDEIIVPSLSSPMYIRNSNSSLSSFRRGIAATGVVSPRAYDGRQ
jgi:hypothetical protein